MSRNQLQSFVDRVHDLLAATWLARRRAGRRRRRRHIEYGAIQLFSALRPRSRGGVEGLGPAAGPPSGQGGEDPDPAESSQAAADTDDTEDEPAEVQAMIEELGLDGSNEAAAITTVVSGFGKSIELFGVGLTAVCCHAWSAVADVVDCVALNVPGGREWLQLRPDLSIHACRLRHAQAAARRWNVAAATHAEHGLRQRRTELEVEVNEILGLLEAAMSMRARAAAEKAGQDSWPARSAHAAQASTSAPANSCASDTGSREPQDAQSSGDLSGPSSTLQAVAAQLSAYPDLSQLVRPKGQEGGTGEDARQENADAAAPAAHGRSAVCDANGIGTGAPRRPGEAGVADVSSEECLAAERLVQALRDERFRSQLVATVERVADAVEAAHSPPPRPASVMAAAAAATPGAVAHKLKIAIRGMLAGRPLGLGVLQDLLKRTYGREGDKEAAQGGGGDAQGLGRRRTDASARVQVPTEKWPLHLDGPAALPERLEDFLSIAVAERQALVQSMLEMQRRGHASTEAISTLRCQELSSRLRLMASLLSMGREIARVPDVEALHALQEPWLRSVNSLLAIDQASPLAPVLDGPPPARASISHFKNVSLSLDYLLTLSAAFHWGITEDPRLYASVVEPFLHAFDVQRLPSLHSMAAASRSALRSSASRSGTAPATPAEAKAPVRALGRMGQPPVVLDSGSCREGAAGGTGAGTAPADGSAEGRWDAGGAAAEAAASRGPEDGSGSVLRIGLDMLLAPASRLDPYNGVGVEIDLDQVAGRTCHEMLDPGLAHVAVQAPHSSADFRGLMLVGDLSDTVQKATDGVELPSYHTTFGYLQGWS